MLLSCLETLVDRPQCHNLNILWWRDIFVLAVKVVFSAELARSRFVALLLARSTVVASLSSSDLLSPHLRSRRRSRILAHVRSRGEGTRLIILLARWLR
jgi:hypothetical protein